MIKAKFAMKRILSVSLAVLLCLLCGCFNEETVEDRISTDIVSELSSEVTDCTVEESSQPKEESDIISVASEECSASAEVSDVSSEEPIEESSAEEYSDEQSSEEESSEEESREPEITESRVSFAACPDILIHPSIMYDAVIREAEKNGVEPSYKNLIKQPADFLSIFENVESIIKNADLSYINVESSVGGDNNRFHGYPNFCSPESYGNTLKELGFDIFNLANNHMLDSGDDDFLKFAHSFFSSENTSVLGYYENEADTDNIVITECRGIKIALLTYTYGTNGIRLENSDTYIPYFNENLIVKQVALAKEKADAVIVSCHWGIENKYSISDDQKKYAELFTELEVDVVIGMHPHCIQKMEYFESESGHKTFVAFSLGNFLTGMQTAANNLGGILTFDIVKNNTDGNTVIENIEFIPTVCHYTAGTRLSDDDRGYRNYKLWLLKDYTAEIASLHALTVFEKNKSYYTLVGGGFSVDNLVKTVKEYIPSEFLDGITY